MELETIKNKIYEIRGQQVMLEAINDLSEDCRRETDEIYFALSQLARKNCELQTRRIAGFRKTDKK